MIKNHISSLFNKLGINPGYRGYPYLVHVVDLATTYYGKPFPCMNELYNRAALHFGISESKVKNDIRTLLRNYWNQKNADKFSAVIGYPVFDYLTTKEFVAIVAVHISINE